MIAGRRNYRHIADIPVIVAQCTAELGRITHGYGLCHARDRHCLVCSDIGDGIHAACVRRQGCIVCFHLKAGRLIISVRYGHGEAEAFAPFDRACAAVCRRHGVARLAAWQRNRVGVFRYLNSAIGFIIYQIIIIIYKREFCEHFGVGHTLRDIVVCLWAY